MQSIARDLAQNKREYLMLITLFVAFQELTNEDLEHMARLYYLPPEVLKNQHL